MPSLKTIAAALFVAFGAGFALNYDRQPSPSDISSAFARTYESLTATNVARNN